jgi:hypothetical protein
MIILPENGQKNSWKIIEVVGKLVNKKKIYGILEIILKIDIGG